MSDPRLDKLQSEIDTLKMRLDNALAIHSTMRANEYASQLITKCLMEAIDATGVVIPRNTPMTEVYWLVRRGIAEMKDNPENDRYHLALTKIATLDPMDSARADNLWARKIAREALGISDGSIEPSEPWPRKGASS